MFPRNNNDSDSCSVFPVSRRLWQHVTASLKAGNMDAATEHKHCLEERQRSEGKQRASTKIPWKARYFIKEVRRSITSTAFSDQ